MSVEISGDEHPIGRESLDGGCHDLVDCSEGHVAGGRGGNGKLIVIPGACVPPVSEALPVPGYAGDWWVDT